MTSSPPAADGRVWTVVLGLAVLATAATGWLVSPRAAGMVLSGALVGLGCCRLLLPTARAGDLVVRGRVIDGAIYLGVGAVLGLISVVLPP